MTDPLSDVLSLLNARGTIFGRAEGGGDWCIESGPYANLRFGSVLEGSCWLHVTGTEPPVHLQAGDCYLLTDGQPYRIASNLTLPPMDMRDVLAQVVNGFVRWSEPVDFQMVGGRFSLESLNASFLLDSLPPVIHIKVQGDATNRLRWVREAIVVEQRSDEAGSASMLEHLTQIMLIQMIRLYLSSGQSAPARGWLAALADAKVGGALAAMHSAPFEKWKLDTLADHVGMSRSALSLRFKTLVGTSPLHYLLHWRMRLAGHALVETNATVSSIGLTHGYESETAFSAAFKRVMGVSPRTYRSTRT